MSAGLAIVLWWPNESAVAEGLLLAFLVPGVVAAFLTTPLSRAFGGRLETRRAVFLALAVLLLELPIALVWRGALMLWPGATPSVVFLAAFLAGPAIWLREMSLFGLSRASHSRSLPAALLQPVLALAGAFVLFPPSPRVLVATLFFLAIGFLCSAALLRAADRPLRREFQSSGISLIRPLLDHVAARDPGATRALEGFFEKFSFPADLKVRLLSFVRPGRPRATVALPTVHPGPFAALGASDLPRKLSEQLGEVAGTVLVPHTPSDHDLDLPTQHEVDRIGAASRHVLASFGPPLAAAASPLVTPYPGSLARAQIFGDVALVLVTQAPAPTDDIAYSVADRIDRELGATARCDSRWSTRTTPTSRARATSATARRRRRSWSRTRARRSVRRGPQRRRVRSKSASRRRETTRSVRAASVRRGSARWWSAPRAGPRATFSLTETIWSWDSATRSSGRCRRSWTTPRS